MRRPFVIRLLRVRLMCLLEHKSFVLRASHEFEPHHDPRPTAGRILNLTAVLWLAIDCNIHLKLVFNPISANPVPFAYRLVFANTVKRGEVLDYARVEAFNEVVNERQSVPLRCHVPWPGFRLISVQYAAVQIVEAVPRQP